MTVRNPVKGILASLRGPEDLKRLAQTELPGLAREIRERIIEVVTRNGGHLASNLGVVELTIALHRVFNSPVDKIVWDVGHQSYPHKLLTGRGADFDSIRKKGGLSGFPKTSESEHDAFDTGHSSTAISAALGLLVAKERRGEPGRVIAVVGDGSLTGGMAFEALNHAGHMQENLIIVVNDNHMSISPNVGALSSYLSRIAATQLYQALRTRFDHSVKRIPRFGSRIMDLIERGKKAVKTVLYKETIFSDLGYEYVGPIDGHNMSTLATVFRNVRQLNKPVVVHVVTQKGRGSHVAEGDPTLYHGVAPFSTVDGNIERKTSLTFSEVFAEAIVENAAEDDRVVAITAAMETGTGLGLFRAKFPSRFFDVGISEQHAVTFAAGLAAGEMRPVVALYSTFLQRSVDQLIHDVALPGLPVVVVVDRAGLVGDDGETHQGIYDMAILRSIPGLTVYVPTGEVDLRAMLSVSLSATGPSIIRYPKDACGPVNVPAATGDPGRGVFLQRSGEDLLLVAVGALAGTVMEAGNQLARLGIPVDVFAIRRIAPFDEAEILRAFSGYPRVFSFEDGVRTGGVGEAISAALVRNGLADALEYHALGVPDTFAAQGTRAQLLAECCLDVHGIVGNVAERIPSRRMLPVSKPRGMGSGTQ